MKRLFWGAIIVLLLFGVSASAQNIGSDLDTNKVVEENIALAVIQYIIETRLNPSIEILKREPKYYANRDRTREDSFFVWYSFSGQYKNWEDFYSIKYLNDETPKKAWTIPRYGEDLIEVEDVVGAVAEYRAYFDSLWEDGMIYELDAFAWSYTKFAIVLISPDKRSADVYLYYSCGSLCGTVEILQLYRTDGCVWGIVGRKQVAVF